MGGKGREGKGRRGNEKERKGRMEVLGRGGKGWEAVSREGRKRKRKVWERVGK